MEFYLQSTHILYLGALCTAVLIGWDPTTPPPPHLVSNTRALLVSQDRRHLSVTPCFIWSLCQVGEAQLVGDQGTRTAGHPELPKQSMCCDNPPPGCRCYPRSQTDRCHGSYYLLVQGIVTWTLLPNGPPDRCHGLPAQRCLGSYHPIAWWIGTVDPITQLPGG